MYFQERKIIVDGKMVEIYITDDLTTARRLRGEDRAVIIYLHEGNRDRNFSEFLYAVEEPEGLEEWYLERIWRRVKGLPWRILETKRCLIRESTEGDVEAFYGIYSNPTITQYMEDLYPDVEQEKQYIREYAEKVYSFYEHGIWTVVEKESGAVIGRAGLDCREGYQEAELGFVIGVPWQRKGYAYEVCSAILAYGAEQLGFQKIQAFVEPGNIASLELCAKLGMKFLERVRIKEQEYVRLMWVESL